MTFSKILLASTLAFTASSVAGCSANSAETVVQNATDKTSYQKPGASVTYSHNLKPQLSAGETATFKLTLNESYDAGTLAVSISTDGGVASMISTQAEFDMSTGDEHQMDISILASENGRHYINVQAQATDGSGNSQPRIFSIPVQVGPKTAQKPNANMRTLDNGQNVIEMEAEEEIIVK